MKFIERKTLVTDFGIFNRLGVSDFLKPVLAKRISSVDDLMVSQINGVFDLQNLYPFDLPEMDVAVAILSDAKKNQKSVLCVVDYDTDGISSGAVLFQGLGLADFNVSVMVTDRYKDGYGFSEGACDKILAMDVLPDVLITADLGSSDGIQIKRLQDESKSRGHNISIIVTDHHHISKETPPATADAFVNPSREDVFHVFTHPICGAAVAWFLVKAFYENNGLPSSLYIGLLDYVAVATVADMVSLKDPLNRAIVVSGLSLMNYANGRTTWLALKDELRELDITEETIGFKIAPRINALSRMGDDGHTALEWLTSDDEATVRACFVNMNINNEDRKEEQLQCEQVALEMAKKQVAQGAFVCVCYVPDFTHGVVGLAASHIVNELGVPSIVLSSKEEGSLSGSCRSVPGFDIRLALQVVQDKTGVMKKYGGHTMAAGLSLASEADVDTLFEAINDYAASVFNGNQPEPIFYHDGLLPSEMKSVPLVKELRTLSPFGQEFPSPSFLLKGLVSGVSLMGSEQNHAKLKLVGGDEFIWFKHGADAEALIGKEIEAVVSPSVNVWQNRERVQFIAQAAKEVCVG